MGLFQPPSSTPYDLRFSIVGIPVRVHPVFWVISLLFGFYAGSIEQILIWVVVVFVSILIHELGHSLAMRFYGTDSYIVLHGMGGLAIPTTARRGGGQWGNSTPDWVRGVLISLAGPFAGFLLASLVVAGVALSGGVVFVDWIWGFIPFPIAFLMDGSAIMNSVISTMLWVNVFWGLINLLPVFPLDGGQVSRYLFVRFDPWDGVKKSLLLSVIAGGAIAITGFVLLKSIYMGFLFGLLAYQSYQAYDGRGRLF